MYKYISLSPHLGCTFSLILSVCKSTSWFEGMHTVMYGDSFYFMDFNSLRISRFYYTFHCKSSSSKIQHVSFWAHSDQIWGCTGNTNSPAHFNVSSQIWFNLRRGMQKKNTARYGSKVEERSIFGGTQHTWGQTVVANQIKQSWTTSATRNYKVGPDRCRIVGADANNRGKKFLGPVSYVYNISWMWSSHTCDKDM